MKVNEAGQMKFIMKASQFITDQYNAKPTLSREKQNGVLQTHTTRHYKPNLSFKQVECLAALCRAYVEVLFGGQSSSYVQTTLLVFLCCEATGG